MTVEIPRPDLKDPLTWATISETHAQWVKLVAPKYGIDVPKYMLGDVLSTIIGDDSNCFGIRCAPFDSKLATLSRELLLIRLRWEIDTPETPDKIRERLKQFLGEAEKADWSSERSFEDIRSGWIKKVKHFVRREIALNPQYRTALDYELQSASVLSEEYQVFLYGKSLG